MALIRCPDCGCAVSDLAPFCKDCGRPIASGGSPSMQGRSSGNNKGLLVIAIIVTVVVSLVGFAAAILLSGGAPPPPSVNVRPPRVGVPDAMHQVNPDTTKNPHAPVAE